MRKGAKISGIVVGAVVALLVVLGVAAKLLITPERVKVTVVTLVEKHLHRTLKLGEIKVSIFSGIVLHDLAVMEKDGKAPFLQTHEAQLRYQFWPLLHRRVVVDKISLDGLKLHVVRLPDGTFNYSDITAKKEAPEQAKPSAKGELSLVLHEVEVKDSEISYEDRKTESGPPALYKVTDLNLSAKKISLQEPFPIKVDGKIFATAFEVQGMIANPSDKPSFDGTIRVPHGDLKNLVAALPPALALKVRPLDPSGMVKVDLKVAGPASAPVKELLKSGTIDLSNVQVTASGQRPTVAGHFKLDGDAISSQDTTVTLAPNKLNIALAVAHLMAKPLVVSSTVKADTFSLDPFLKKEAETPAPGGAAKPEPEPKNLPVQASGTVQIGNTSYKGLPITGLYTKYRLDSNVLTIEELRGNAAGGSFSDRGRIDLGRKGYAYTTRLAVRGVHADQVVKALAPKSAGKFFGTVALNAEVTGAGIQTASIMKKATGRGDFNITGGRLVGTPLLREFSRFLNVPALRDVHFTTFAGTFRLSGGNLFLDSTIASKDLQTSPKGAVGLINKRLDLTLPTKLSPALSTKLSPALSSRVAGKFVAEAMGSGAIPLKVTGTFSAPKVSLSTSAMAAPIGKVLKKNIEQTIKKPGEQLQKELKGIFGQ